MNLNPNNGESMYKKPITHRQFLVRGLAGLSCSLLVACGDGADSSSPVTDNPILTEGKAVEGPLDPIQDALMGTVISGEIAVALPVPLGPATACLGDALNRLVDGPDALLLALTGLPSGADPVGVLQAAGDQLAFSVEDFAAETQAALMVLGGQLDDCGGPRLPVAGNPLAGTPLEPVGASLENVLAALRGQGSDDDENLGPLVDALAPALAELAGAFGMLPPEVKDAPVLGGLLGALETAVADLALTMPAVGAYDAMGTQAGVESLLNNLLANVLLGVLPVSEIDEATGQDFSGQIQAGIDEATAALGDGLGLLITPLFDELLNGALEPVLDPVEGLLAELLNPSGLAAGNPLDGLLSDLAGNGTGTPLDALLALLAAGASGHPLSDLTGLIGGDISAAPLEQLTGLLGGSGLPLDALLGQLAGSGGLAALDDLLGLAG